SSAAVSLADQPERRTDSRALYYWAGGLALAGIVLFAVAAGIGLWTWNNSKGLQASKPSQPPNITDPEKPPPPPVITDPKKSPSPTPPPLPSTPGFVALFNGKDLSGWKTHPQKPGDWEVKDGILIGGGTTSNHLYTQRDDFQNFHLRAVARVNNLGNS